MQNYVSSNIGPNGTFDQYFLFFENYLSSGFQILSWHRKQRSYHPKSYEFMHHHVEHHILKHLQG